MNKKKLIIGIVVSVLVVSLGCVLLVTGVIAFVGSKVTGNLPIAIESTESTAQQMVNAVPQTTEVPQMTAPPTEIAVSLPSELSGILLKSGYDFEDLESTNQLIVVTGENDDYHLQCYECNDGLWQSTDIKSKVFVGKNGTISPDEKTEGDYYSPKGLYDLGFAFGTKDNPGTKMEYRDVYEGIYWVDDPDSDFYNQWVDTKNQKIQWASAEKMWSYDEYIYGAVINYNTDPIVKNNGSAIFLHVGYKYTAGCVASDEETIVSILKWLNPADNPKILIY
ncbi:MAG: hypothetical protein E7530_05275 [Ruminococcaceae bacterium]|nr:hypothetical protein [Oscillospiraceae bacterium]